MPPRLKLEDIQSPMRAIVRTFFRMVYLKIFLRTRGFYYRDDRVNVSEKCQCKKKSIS